MNKLSVLKDRLEKLPKLREARTYQGKYVAYTKKADQVKEQVEKVFKAIESISDVLPHSVSKPALDSAKAACKLASDIKGRLHADVSSIATSNTESKFIRLSDKANASLSQCEKKWKSEIVGKVKNWEIISEVVAKIGESEEGSNLSVQSKKLKQVIGSLLVAADSLPQRVDAAKKVKAELQDLSDSVSKLGLDTPFGKFLQEAASPTGASLGSAQIEEVSQQINALGLGEVFRVQIPN